MRNLYLSLLVLVLGGSSLSAQYLGVRAGANFTKLTVDIDGASVSYDSKTNPVLGLFFDLPVGGERFLLSPELSYVVRGYDFDFDFFGVTTEIKANFNYLDLGLLAKYMIVDNGSVGFYLGAGPVVSYALNGSTETDGDKEDIEFDDEDGFNRTNINIAAVGGLTFAQKFFVEARYMAGLSSLNEDDGDDGTTKWSSIGLNAGARFSLGN